MSNHSSPLKFRPGDHISEDLDVLEKFVQDQAQDTRQKGFVTEALTVWKKLEEYLGSVPEHDFDAPVQFRKAEVCAYYTSMRIPSECCFVEEFVGDEELQEVEDWMDNCWGIGNDRWLHRREGYSEDMWNGIISDLKTIIAAYILSHRHGYETTFFLRHIKHELDGWRRTQSIEGIGKLQNYLFWHAHLLRQLVYEVNCAKKQNADPSARL